MKNRRIWFPHLYRLQLNLESFPYPTAKSARLRQAKEEAEREIAEYRKQMEDEFQRKVAEVGTPAHPVLFPPPPIGFQGPNFYLVVYRAAVTLVQMSSASSRRQRRRSNSSTNRLQASPQKSSRCFWGMSPPWRTEPCCAWEYDRKLVSSVHLLFRRAWWEIIWLVAVIPWPRNKLLQ